MKKPDELAKLRYIYVYKLFSDVGFSDSKPCMSYVIIHGDMERRMMSGKLSPETKEEYQKRKKKFKGRLKLISTKNNYETAEDLELFYAEFLKSFISGYSTYFKKTLLEKIKKGEDLDNVDKAVFWMFYTSNHPHPFNICADYIYPIKLKMVSEGVGSYH